ncbi:hypothetical protein MSAN_00838200 [Mycena sanguinolenta]|uniref:Uncharacterized protein n=1 Tax=Mycena sanguinolenta TaxID=230812 RepID=A0A8H6YV87_9AGAR|nr:hypothetical protein MSAN_00838200 [Mycena sanguinolenta]
MTTTTMTTTRTYTPTATPMSISLSPSISSSVSGSASVSASTSISTTTVPTGKTTTVSRVRFDAECILIPELGYSYSSKRPRMVTKSYSLPLWKRGRDEEDVVLKVALPSFKSRKPSSRSRERNRDASRSPPAITPTLPSCLRAPTIAFASDSASSRPPPSPSASASPSFSSLAAEESAPITASASTCASDTQAPTASSERLPPMHSPPLAALPAIYTSPIVSPSELASTSSPPLSSSPSTSAAPLSSSPPNTYVNPHNAQLQTVPLRPCCPECVANAKMDVQEEAFSRGALRVRRRGAAFGHGTGIGGGALFEAARRGGFLDMASPPTPVSPGFAGPGGQDPLGGRGEGSQLISGTGLAQVNRLVAELEERRLRTSRSATPTPPVSPTEPTATGRASPSLLGPALARIADPLPETQASATAHKRDAAVHAHGYGDLLVPGDALAHPGSGRASPLLPLGIAVDEVDKVRRKRSESEFGSGVLGGADAVLEALSGMDEVVIDLDDADTEGEGESGEGGGGGTSPTILHDRTITSSPTGSLASLAISPSATTPASSVPGIPASAPPASTSFPSSSSFPTFLSANPKRRSFNAPVRGYADDDDADLFPLPSSSRAATPSSVGDAPREPDTESRGEQE